MFQLLLAVIYLSFISLGLPDSLLGSAWPTIYPEFDVPVSYAGIISMIISAGTIISSLQSDRITKKLGPGKVTAVSVLTTAIALFGFSTSSAYWMLVVWAIPYGLGAGGVDAALNNYVALHYESKHMSWLHCMWGLGASISPYIMTYALSNANDWHKGYQYVSIIQFVLTAFIVFSLPLWKNAGTSTSEISDSDSKKYADDETNTKVLTLKEILQIRGAKSIMLVMFGYCALEQTSGLWASMWNCRMPVCPSWKRCVTAALSTGSVCRFAGLVRKMQFHPELRSRPDRPHPLFREFIQHTYAAGSVSDGD